MDLAGLRIYQLNSSHLVSLPALTDSSVTSGLTVSVDPTGALRAGVSVAPHERVSGITRWTLTDGSVPLKYNIVQHIKGAAWELLEKPFNWLFQNT